MTTDERWLPGEGIPQTLSSLIHLVEKRIRCHFRGTGLHWGLRRILQRLFIQDGMSQVELSAATGSSEASISNMLKHLVSGGWVERRQDEYDYRMWRVYLADKGVALRDAIAGELGQIDDAVRSELGEADAQTLESLLERAGAAFRAITRDQGEARFQSLAEHPSPPGEL